jgi:RimJ/RimL family protein N-acetyltransferase
MARLFSDRLTLRPPTLGDAPRLAALTRDPGVARMVTSMPYPQPAISAEGFLLIAEARAVLDAERIYAVDLPGEGLIGLCGVHPAGGTLEIGYWIGRPYWGHGFATEAARTLAGAARDLERGPVVAGHFADNPASGRVLEKAGFVYTGEIAERFSLARSERAPTRMMRLAA